MKKFIVTIRNAYHEIQERNDVKAIFLLVLLTLAIVWFFFSLESIFELINQYSTRILQDSTSNVENALTWSDSIFQTLPSLIFLIIILLWIRYSYGSRKQSIISTHLEHPSKHEGLIFLLGPYKSRPEFAKLLDVPKTTTELEELLKNANPTPDLRTKILASTWGPLWIAIETHWPKLKYVWLVSTSGPKGSFQECETAKLMIQKVLVTPVSDGDIQCFYEECSVDNGYDISKVVPIIDWIYTTELPALNLDVSRVIADFTGATKAMTAGMILATLDRNRKIQYLRQDKDIISKDGDQLRALSNTEIDSVKLLVIVETRHELVPVSRPARDKGHDDRPAR